MDSQMIRIGIVGAGGIVRHRHMPGFAELDGVEVVAICNRTPESAERFASEYGIPRTLERWEDLVGLNELDAVLIGTWPYLHHPITMAALDAGKHVFCQARMAMDFRQAREMWEAAEKTDRVTMVCPEPSGIPIDALMRKLIDDGAVGQILEVHVRALNAAWADPMTPMHWRLDRKYSGLNTLILGLVFERLRRWLGDAVQVTGMGRTFHRWRPDPATGERVEVQVPDALMVTAELESGGLMHMDLSGVAQFAGPTTVEILGSEGTLKWHWDTLDVWLGRRGSEVFEKVEVPMKLVGQWRVERDFISAIRSGTPVYPSFHDGMKYMEFTEAVHRSINERLFIDLPLS